MIKQFNTVKQAIALSLGIFSFSSSAADVLTAEEVIGLQQVAQVQVSPSGDNVAFTRYVPRQLYKEENGAHWAELYLVDGKGVERPYITGQVTITNIQWSADGSLVYFLAKMGEDKHTALYRIPFNGGQAVKTLSLKGTDVADYALSHNGKQVALIAKPAKDSSVDELKKLGFMAEVYEEDLTTKQLFVLDLAVSDKPLTPVAWPIDDVVSAVQWSADDSQLLVKTQPTALIDDQYMKSQWHIVDANQQKIMTSFITEGKLGSAEFSYDGQYVAILGAQDKHDPALGRLYLAETKTGKISSWLPNHLGHVSDFEWKNKSNELYFISNINTDSIVGLLRPGSSDYRTVVKPGQLIASQLSLSDSDKTLVMRANNAKHPNEVYRIGSRDSSATRLSNSNPWLDNKRFAKQESISFTTSDGVDIGGVLIYPLNYKKGQRYPLIMSVHGGPESHDKDGWLTNYSRPGQLAAAQGYAVFYPNYRGSTGKGVDYSKLGQNDYAGKEFDDLVSFKDHLVDMGLVDAKRVGITGGSYGGYASAWAATKLTDHFAASVMFVGVTNQLSKFGTTDISNEMHLVHARSYPWEKWQWYLERSPIYWAGQSKTPLLIMHGKEDPRVHPAQSMELYRYMKVQGKAVRLVYYPGEGHGNRKAAAQYDYHLRLMRWMDHYLKQDASDLPSFELDHKAKLEAVKTQA
ncbi:S9 family peptidase [Shewanella algidipiscicola]|uniref:Peptidase YuxL n=1 Tax=Shewanella algidipiscicola TaxID=614070 RepID=A0ABQ4P5Q9_9GAMM|nr:S9 family peptidase [Shewanella algidipiscicola]GIU42874.1 putative peptidase YuxL [Shewanella algidipiscicola]